MRGVIADEAVMLTIKTERLLRYYLAVLMLGRRQVKTYAILVKEVIIYPNQMEPTP
jgi:hypothetical protein